MPSFVVITDWILLAESNTRATYNVFFLLAALQVIRKYLWFAISCQAAKGPFTIIDIFTSVQNVHFRGEGVRVRAQRTLMTS